MLVVLANLRINISGQECIRSRRYDEAAEELGERGHCFWSIPPNGLVFLLTHSSLNRNLRPCISSCVPPQF
jgi:hypothetical protein